MHQPSKNYFRIGANTGHSEHEYITHEQFLLDLEMYAAMLVEFAGEQPDW